MVWRLHVHHYFVQFKNINLKTSINCPQFVLVKLCQISEGDFSTRSSTSASCDHKTATCTSSLGYQRSQMTFCVNYELLWKMTKIDHMHICTKYLPFPRGRGQIKCDTSLLGSLTSPLEFNLDCSQIKEVCLVIVSHFASQIWLWNFMQALNKRFISHSVTGTLKAC